MIEKLETQPQRDARRRLADFIEQARNGCAAFGSDLDWESYVWDVTAHCPRPPHKSHDSSRIYFTSHEGGTRKSIEGRTPLPEPFCSLIKAIVRTAQDARPQTVHPLARLVNASRDLALELADRNYDPCLLLPDDFAAAARRAKKRASGKTVYRLGQSLEVIAKRIDELGIAFCRLDWRNPHPRIANNGSRSSAVAESAREASIPDNDVLDSLAAIWNAVDSPSDTVLMGCVTLLHCAPWRIVETLSLDERCEVKEQKQGRNGLVFDANGIGVFRYGIRYWKEKSGEPDIKWIPSVMVDVAKDAISRIREATAPARRLAKWLHDHPNRAWLPDEDMDPYKIYSVRDVQAMFNMASPAAVRSWLKKHDVPLTEQVYGRDGKFRLLVKRADLEAALLADMPLVPVGEDEPALHERLFITFRNEHNSQRRTNPCLLELVTDQQVRDFLGGRPDDVKSGFERLLQKEGMRARTHQFRHWLNTIAQVGGLEQGLIARWSGRDDIQQNSEYDHISAMQLAEKARELFANDQALGPLADMQAALQPVERTAFRETVVATAHVTEIGFCLSDWNSSACPQFGACGTCEDCAFIKGDVGSKQRVAAMRDENAWIAERLEAEVDDGTIGASQHHKAATDMIAALDRILAIHDDDTVPDGTLVQPNAASPVHYGGPSIRSAA
jgi:hypothetical protein